MKRILIIPFLLLAVSFAEAEVKPEKIKVDFNVSGPGCKHLFIKDKDGVILLVSTEKELFSVEKESDPSLLRQMKREMIKAGFTELTSKVDLKKEIEKIVFSVGEGGK